MHFIEKGEFKICDGFGIGGDIIRRAHNLHYKNKDLDLASLINIVKNDNNMFIFDFSWYVLEITATGTIYTIEDIHSILLEYCFLNVDYYNSNKIIVSGTGKAWYDIFDKENRNKLPFSVNPSKNLIQEIMIFLQSYNPTLFKVKNLDSINVHTPTFITIKLLDVQDVDKLPENIIKKHKWFAVEFNKISFAFIQEIMKYKKLSCIQPIIRYIPQKDFGMVMGIHINNKEKIRLIELLEKLQSEYNYLLNKSYKREEINQLLPIGLESECMVSGNINDWENLFTNEIKENNYWETQKILTELKIFIENIIRG